MNDLQASRRDSRKVRRKRDRDSHHPSKEAYSDNVKDYSDSYSGSSETLPLVEKSARKASFRRLTEEEARQERTVRAIRSTAGENPRDRRPRPASVKGTRGLTASRRRRGLGEEETRQGRPEE
jgi:hypothetical protein